MSEDVPEGAGGIDLYFYYRTGSRKIEVMNLYSFCLAMLVGTLVEFKSALILTTAVIVVTNPEIPVIKKRVWDVMSFVFSNTYRDLEKRIKRLGETDDTATSATSPNKVVPVKKIVQKVASPESRNE